MTIPKLNSSGKFNISQSFILLGVTLGFWALTSNISKYLDQGIVRREHSKIQSEPEEKIDPKLEKLRERSASVPKDAKSRLKFAKELAQEAKETSDSQMLIQAFTELQAILETDPKNKKALAEISGLALESGLISLATDYYQKYLELEPNDLRRKNDYALALIQSDKSEKAIEVLKEILKDDPQLFPTHLTLALAYKMNGNIPEAIKETEFAIQIAPDEVAREKASGFLTSLKNPEAAKATKSKQSPATMVSSYFTNHQIIGPKMTGINWPNEKTANVIVRDFPVQNMPEMARKAFITKTQAHFSTLKEKIKIQIVDQETEETLLTVDVGPENSPE
jgi:tetratricopeptide (TPR) repeat protein